MVGPDLEIKRDSLALPTCEWVCVPSLPSLVFRSLSIEIVQVLISCFLVLPAIIQTRIDPLKVS